MEPAASNTTQLRQTRWTARGILLVAIATPMAFSASAYHGGRIAGQIMMLLVILMSLAWFVFRRREPLQQAQSSLVVALVVFAWSAYSTFSAVQDDSKLRAAAANYERVLAAAAEQPPAPKLTAAPVASTGSENSAVVMARVLDRMAQAGQAQVVKNQALDAKFEALAAALATALTPDSLASAVGRQVTRRQLGEVDLLISERRKAFDAAIKSGDEILLTSGLGAADLAEAQATTRSGNARSMELMTALDAAQRAYLPTVSRILDLCEPAHCTASGGQILFDSEPRLAAYQRELALLNQQLAADQSAAAAWGAHAQATQARIRSTLQKIQR